MSAYRRLFAMGLLASSLTVGGTAGAQTLQRLAVDVSQTVRVTSADGKVTQGKIRTLTPTQVIVEPGGSGKQSLEPVSVTIADIQRIQLTDSATDGVVKGVLTGGLAGWLVGTAFDAGAVVGDVIGAGFGMLLGAEVEPVSRSNGAKTGTLLGVVAGAALGLAIDQGKMKTIYERENGTTLSVLPISSSAGNGVGLRVSW